MSIGGYVDWASAGQTFSSAYLVLDCSSKPHQLTVYRCAPSQAAAQENVIHHINDLVDVSIVHADVHGHIVVAEQYFIKVSESSTRAQWLSALTAAARRAEDILGPKESSEEEFIGVAKDVPAAALAPGVALPAWNPVLGAIGEATHQAFHDPTVSLLGARAAVATMVELHPELKFHFQPHLARKEWQAQLSMLTITIVSGLSLAPKDPNGLSDPFVQVFLAASPSTPIAVTPVVRETLNPHFAFDVVIARPPLDQSVVFKIWDEDEGKQNDYLGEVWVPISSILAGQAEHVFPVKGDKNVYGGLLLRFNGVPAIPTDCLKFPPYVAPAAPDWLNDDFMDTFRREYKENRRRAGQLTLRGIFHPPKHDWEGMVQIQVISATELDAKDRGGTSDPYVRVTLSDRSSSDTSHDLSLQRQSTSVIKKTTSAFWPTTEPQIQLVVPPANLSNPYVLKLDVIDWNAIGSHEKIGSCVRLLHNLKWEHKWVEENLELTTPLLKNEIDKNFGKKMRREGWRPAHPVIVIPGFCSSALRVERTDNPEYQGTRVWLSLEKLLATSASKNLVTSVKNKLVSRGERKVTSNELVRHLKLAPHDMSSDPPGVSVRCVPGTEGVSYLSDNPLMRTASYVMGPFIRELRHLGYTKKNLYAASYDWRVPPHVLEQRDHFFSNLKHVITQMVANNNNTPVAVFCHSMGNRTFQYFTNHLMAVDPVENRRWLDYHIKTFIAVGAPFLGAPKSLRGFVSGDRMGLDAFLEEPHGVEFARTLGSLHGLTPIVESQWHKDSVHGPTFMHLRKPGVENPTSLADYEPLSEEAAMVRSHAGHVFSLGRQYFQGPFGEAALMAAPPVKKMLAIYGINLETETHFFYRQSRSDPHQLVLDKKASNLTLEGYSIRGGIAYEQKNLVQPALSAYMGMVERRCGDGTVPYSSLSWVRAWQNQLDLTLVELPGAEHRDILVHQGLWKHVIDDICIKGPPPSDAEYHSFVAEGAEEPTAAEKVQNVGKAAMGMVNSIFSGRKKKGRRF